MKIIRPEWPAPAQVRACTTTRHVWGAESPGSDVARQSLQTLLSLPEDPIWLRQTHGATAIEASAENRNSEADASFTHLPNQVCVILTADCLPILVSDKQGSCIAGIHAGWRGLASGVMETTLDNLSLTADETLVWLGPAIGPSKFEVGEDVYDAFMSQQANASQAFQPRQPGKWLADLYHLTRLRLEKRGITQVYGGNFCTYTQNDLFFSYRRDQGQTGRMASVIWLDAPR